MAVSRAPDHALVPGRGRGADATGIVDGRGCTQANATFEADILIAGYGPTGTTLAALLGRRGWRVTILDKAAAIYDRPRAITADHQALRVFQEIGIADEIAAAAIPHPGTDYLGVDGQVIKRFYPAPPPEPPGWTTSWGRASWSRRVRRMCWPMWFVVSDDAARARSLQAVRLLGKAVGKLDIRPASGNEPRPN